MTFHISNRIEIVALLIIVWGRLPYSLSLPSPFCRMVMAPSAPLDCDSFLIMNLNA